MRIRVTQRTRKDAVARKAESILRRRRARGLAGILAGYGISPETAHRAATEIRATLPAHRLGSAWRPRGDQPHAAAIARHALSSCAAALIAVCRPSVAAWAITGTLVALVLTGFISLAVAGVELRSCLRLLIGGALGLALTYCRRPVRRRRLIGRTVTLRRAPPPGQFRPPQHRQHAPRHRHRRGITEHGQRPSVLHLVPSG